MNEHDTTNGAEEEMFELLRHSLEQLPLRSNPADETPPHDLIAGSKLVYEWLNMDAELAELQFDSATNPELAGVRSAEGSLRELTFVAAGRRLEIEIERRPHDVCITGRIEPPAIGTVQFVVGGEVFRSEIMPDGSFEIVEIPQGTVLAYIDTEDGRIRLGDFGI